MCLVPNETFLNQPTIRIYLLLQCIFAIFAFLLVIGISVSTKGRHGGRAEHHLISSSGSAVHSNLNSNSDGSKFLGEDTLEDQLSNGINAENSDDFDQDDGFSVETQQNAFDNLLGDIGKGDAWQDEDEDLENKEESSTTVKVTSTSTEQEEEESENDVGWGADNNSRNNNDIEDEDGGGGEGISLTLDDNDYHQKLNDDNPLHDQEVRSQRDDISTARNDNIKNRNAGESESNSATTKSGSTTMKSTTKSAAALNTRRTDADPDQDFDYDDDITSVGGWEGENVAAAAEAEEGIEGDGSLHDAEGVARKHHDEGVHVEDTDYGQLEEEDDLKEEGVESIHGGGSSRGKEALGAGAGAGARIDTLKASSSSTTTKTATGARSGVNNINNINNVREEEKILTGGQDWEGENVAESVYHGEDEEESNGKCLGISTCIVSIYM